MKFLDWRKSKKGFTLIELIVVIVILAILAAAAIPSMIGFIDQAKGAQYIAEAQTVYLAGQSACTKFYHTTADSAPITQATNAAGTAGGDVESMVRGSITTGATYSIAHTNARVTGVTYSVKPTSTSKTYKVVIDAGKDAVLTIS